jgi:hypothetical protein
MRNPASPSPGPSRDPLQEDPAIVLLKQILEELRELRVAYERRQPGDDDEALAFVIEAIYERVGDNVFVTSEIIVLANKTDPESRALHEALQKGLGTLNARRLGKALMRAEGRDLAGRVVVRVGDSRNGVIWRISLASSPYSGFAGLKLTQTRSSCPVTLPPMKW